MNVFEKPPQPLPIGEAKQLEELASKKWQEHLLLFSRVKNRVSEVNPDILFPLKLEKGKSSPLGLFAEAYFLRKPVEIPRKKQALEYGRTHHRSALLGRAIFADKQGRIYRDLDLKGVGSLWSAGTREGGSYAYARTPGRVVESGREGLLQEDMALFDRQATEELLSAGIRTNRVIAIIKLREIIVNGEKIPIKEAVRKGICEEDFHPVVEVRAFGTKARVDDVRPRIGGRGMNADQKLLLEDARALVSQERGLKKAMSEKAYLEWFAKTLGRNMGMMHKKGWLHNYIIPHNITLDCRIVDFDATTSIENESQWEEEVNNAIYVFKELLELISGSSSLQESLLGLFQKSYDKAFSPQKREKYFERLQKQQGPEALK